MLIELPSGLRGEARKIRGAEAIELAERASSPGGNSLGSILRGCWIRTIDAGPYKHAVVGEPGLDWDRVLKGDLLVGLLTMRAASIPSVRDPDPTDLWPGKRYDFQVQCEKCRKKYAWSVDDIVNDLERKKLPPASAEAMRAGEAFRATARDADGPSPVHAVSGAGASGVHELTFDLMLPEQDEILRTMMKQLTIGVGADTKSRRRVTMVESLAVQTRTIDGAAKSPAARQRFFANLDLGELNRLREVYDDADCGVDIDIVTKCQDAECEWQQETTLPLGRTFWRPEMPKRHPATLGRSTLDE